MKKFIMMAAASLLVTAGTIARAEDAPKAKEVELSGALACGHCKYHIGDGCSAAFKTEDGKIYIIKDPSKEIMAARFKGGTVKVTGSVEEKDKLLYVTASKAELAK
jgi:hypothetical protein